MSGLVIGNVIVRFKKAILSDDRKQTNGHKTPEQAKTDSAAAPAIAAAAAVALPDVSLSIVDARPKKNSMANLSASGAATPYTSYHMIRGLDYEPDTEETAKYVKVSIRTPPSLSQSDIGLWNLKEPDSLQLVTLQPG